MNTIERQDLIEKIEAAISRSEAIRSNAKASINAKVLGAGRNGILQPIVTSNGTKIPMKAPVTNKSQLSKQGKKNVTPAKGSIAERAVKQSLNNAKK